MHKITIHFLATALAAMIFIANIPILANAEESDSYTVNGVALPIEGYEPGTAWDNCWTFANIIYEAIWGTNNGDDLLENLSKSERKITETTTKKYIQAAELGANIRLEDGKGVNEHSMILVQKKQCRLYCISWQL